MTDEQQIGIQRHARDCRDAVLDSRIHWHGRNESLDRAGEHEQDRNSDHQPHSFHAASFERVGARQIAGHDHRTADQQSGAAGNEDARQFDHSVRRP